VPFVAVAEHALMSRKYAAGILLDITGAFSHVIHQSLIAAMKMEGLSDLCIRWIFCMLASRTVEAGIIIRSRVV
jgi:hypothetical protein